MDLSKVILDLKGKEIKDESGYTPTLQDVACTALLMTSANQESADEKLKKFKLAVKLQASQADLCLADKDLIRAQVAKNYGALILGRMCEELYGSI